MDFCPPGDPPGGPKTPKMGGTPKTPKNAQKWTFSEFTYYPLISGEIPENGHFPEIFPRVRGCIPPDTSSASLSTVGISSVLGVVFADISSYPSRALALKRIALALHDDVRYTFNPLASDRHNVDTLLLRMHRSSDWMLQRNSVINTPINDIIVDVRRHNVDAYADQ